MQIQSKLAAAFATIAFICSLSLAAPVHAQSTYPLVDEAFEVPEELVTKDFRLRMLSIHDAVKDYEAVMASQAYLPTLFPRWGGWPNGLTLENNIIDLGWHNREFTHRTSFTYTVTSLDGSKVLGCLYIYPTRKVGYDADIAFWARESAKGDPADRALETAVRDWVAKDWPFKNPGYPGRDMTWEEWNEVPTTKR